MSEKLLPIHFAPLQGFTECAYRQAHFLFAGVMGNGANLGSGIAAYYTPFLRIEKGAAREKDLRDLQRDLEFIKSRQSNCHCENLAYNTNDEEAPRFYNVVPQVICRDASEFSILVDAIQKLKQDCGFATDEVFPQIDINMGCPFPMQAKAGRGSGLLPRIDAVKEIFQEVATLSTPHCHPRESEDLAQFTPHCHPREGEDLASSNPQQHVLKFSVKMRLGYTSPEECLALLPLLNEAPLAHITMHPRLGIQQYKGALDFDAFERFYAQCRLPLIFNGDVTSINDIQAIACRFPNLKGIMIGRGLLANPALATEYQAGSKNTDNPIPALIKIHDALLADYRKHLQGDAQILDKIRPFWTYAVEAAQDPSRGQSDIPKRTIKKIAKARNLDEYLKAVQELS